MSFPCVKVVIPARFESTRLPGKPLLLLQSKPVFWHVAERAKEAGLAKEDIILATDDERILSVASDYGVNGIMTSKDHETGTDRINEVAALKSWADDTIIINIQGDEPLVPSELIKSLIKFTKDNSTFDICTAVCKINSEADFHNPNMVKAVLGEDNRALYFTRSTTPLARGNVSCLDMAYRHIGIYAYSAKSLNQFCSFAKCKLEDYEKLEQLRAIANGMTIGAMISPQMPPHGIDVHADYCRVRDLMEGESVA